jgi:choline-glycine betaine transporter
LAEIRDGINDLAGSRCSGLINEAVDIAFISQQIQANSFDWGSCTKLMKSIMDIIKQVQVSFSFAFSLAISFAISFAISLAISLAIIQLI